MKIASALPTAIFFPPKTYPSLEPYLCSQRSCICTLEALVGLGRRYSTKTKAVPSYLVWSSLLSLSRSNRCHHTDPTTARGPCDAYEYLPRLSHDGHSSV
jgi:hypothetical protein